MSVLNITSNNFESEVLQSDQPVLLDFFANWCMPCRMIGPVVDQIAAEVTDAKVGKINVEEQPELAKQFGIMSIPALMVIKDGKVVKSAAGAKSKKAILQMLELGGPEPDSSDFGGMKLSATAK